MFVVNLIAPPGSGKSTGASYIFSQLKMNGVNAELVTEVAKEKVWENNRKALQNQACIFGEQYFRMFRLIGDVDVIVTDSPLLLSIIYNENPVLGENFNNTVKSVSGSFDNLNFYINRKKPYSETGRLQTETESNWVGEKIKLLLSQENIDYEEIDGDIEGYDHIVSKVLSKIYVRT